MNDHRKSDTLVVAEKPLNKPVKTDAERVEQRGVPEENKRQQNMLRTQRRESVQSKLQLIHQKAKKDKTLKFTTLMHHIYNIDMLRMSYLELKKKAAPGVDKVIWEDYKVNLEGNLQDLSERIKKGSYKAKLVRRVYIPKADGKQRPYKIGRSERSVNLRHLHFLDLHIFVERQEKMVNLQSRGRRLKRRCELKSEK